MMVKSAARYLAPKFLVEDPIDFFCRTGGPLFLEFQRTAQQVGAFTPRFPLIGTSTSIQARHAFGLKATPPPPEGANGNASHLSVRQPTLFPTELLEVPLSLRRGNLARD
jgi:hypothetical protein